MTGPSPTELERAEALAERVLHRDVPRRRMLVIVNPYATTVSNRLKNLVVYALQSRYDVEAVDTQPKLKARYTRWYYTYVAVSQFTRKYLLHPPRVEVEVDGRRTQGVTVIVQNSDPFTYFGPRPIRVNEGAALDNGTLS